MKTLGPNNSFERSYGHRKHAPEETIEIDCQWTDWAGRRHDRFVGRPVSMHAMRGISAHSNGFHACRALHLLQALLGTIDVPGGHLSMLEQPNAKVLARHLSRILAGH